VTVPGFGTFDTSRRKGAAGSQSQISESIQIAARTVPTFKAGKGLKERVKV
jgi:DNA-binding protein HU-beta